MLFVPDVRQLFGFAPVSVSALAGLGWLGWIEVYKQPNGRDCSGMKADNVVKRKFTAYFAQ